MRYFLRHIFHRKVIIIILVLFGDLFAVIAQDKLEEKFKDPPEMAKPRGYWIWCHGNFDYATIKNELYEFKEKGLGGVDIFDFGVADPLDIIPSGPAFLSDEQLDGIEFALKEAKKLDLQVGFSVSNGWNAGGSWTDPDEQSMHLLIWSDTVSGPMNIREIGFPDVPKSFKKPYGEYRLDPLLDENGLPLYYKDVSLIAWPMNSTGVIPDTSRILSFEVEKISNNSVDLDLPEGNWILSRAVVTPMGQHMWMQSDNSSGYIMDHFSKKATKNHFNYVIDKLRSRIGNIEESALERLYVCSFESEAPIEWSPEVPEEFYDLNGYHIDKFIPALSGFTVISRDITERFLYDYRKTISEMFINNHYRQASQICRDNGLLLASESGGPGPPLHDIPSEDLKALGAVDIMRGEFWNDHIRLTEEGVDLMQVVKNIGSAAHIYGHKVVEMEAFTSFNRHWQETPLELKNLADRAFCEGMTRVVYHTMPHSPPEAGMPGWSYQAGTHIHPKMTWWPMMKEFNAYLARCSAMLMEGNFVADVAYYYGDDIPNFAKAKHVRPGLGGGYDYDDLNTEVLLKITEVKDGKIVLPSGMEYSLLVLPEDTRMKLEVINKIEELLGKGATIIGPKPSRIYGLNDYIEKEKELNMIADRIWGKKDKINQQDKKYGAGRIITGISPRKILQQGGIGPDFMYSINPDTALLDYLHRKTPDEDIYFVRNRDSIDVFTEMIFRVKGRQPEIWDPVSGMIRPATIYRIENYGIRIPFKFAPYGSVFIVFTKDENEINPVVGMKHNDQPIFPANLPEPGNFQLSLNKDQNLQFTTIQEGKYSFVFRDGQTAVVEVPGMREIYRMDKPWEVRFPYGWGALPVQRFDKLIDWTTSDNPGLKYFSGIATYRNMFTIDQPIDSDQDRYILDLGLVGNVASVFLNGVDIGDLLYPPYHIDITDHIKSGDNSLVIEVANTWRNRMIGDLDLPLNEQYTRSNVAHGKDPSRRPWSNYDLFPSGLMGPVNIKIVRMYNLKPNNNEN